MLVDPLVLKKKLNRMATEQGAFAVLSSLLLYVTELAASDPQLRSKRTKWAEGKENKVSYKQPCPDRNRGQYPTRFQLLRSRFLNNNREPYTKKRREVGKLVIKEKLWMSRAGNKLDRSRDRKGDGKVVEEDADTVASERARWGSMSGKNTVKNILKKFLAAEEKEANEKSPSWKKKGSNTSLPKIVNKNSVLSKLKEQFEQSALRSAAEVKASLLHKGEKKTKNFTSRKTIRKPEVRMLHTAAMAATDINSPESQYLVCSTVPVPRLSIATELNHPWSWSKNNATNQAFSRDTALKEKRGADREPDENKTPPQEREDEEELLVAPKAKDHAEAAIDSTKQGSNFNSNLDSCSATCKNKSPEDYIPPLSKCSLDCDKNNMPAGPDTSSLLGSTNSVLHVKEGSPPSNSPYSGTAEGSHEQIPQDTKTSEIPEITMYVYSSEEADTELILPEEDTFFAGQKGFPEQALENILPFHSSGVQASCETEPPMEDQQTTLLTPAGKIPPIVQKEAPGLRGRCSEKAKERAKYHCEDKIYSTSSKNDSDVPTKKEEENKMLNSQVQNESKTKQPQLPQMSSPQNNLRNSSADIPNPDVNQIKLTPSLNEGQEQKPGVAEEEHISSHLEKTQGPLLGDLVKHSFYNTEEDIGKDRISSPNEIMDHENSQALGRSNLTDLETCHNQSKSLIEREEATADEMPWPDSEALQSPLSNRLLTPMSGIAGQRIHHTLGKPPALPPIDLRRQEAGSVEDEYACCGCEKDSLPSSDELTNCGNDTTVQKKTACNFKNQVLSSNHPTENENSTAEETNTCQSFDNRLSLSTKKPGKQENKTNLARKPLLPLEMNQTPTSDETMKKRSDMVEENLFPSSTGLVPDQKKHAKGSNKVSKTKKDKLFSSNDEIKHENDKTEREEREERNVLHKSEEETVSTSSDVMGHDNNSSNEENAHRPRASQLPSSEHDNNVQGVKNAGQSLNCPTLPSNFVKHEHELAVDEDIHCNNEKHHLTPSNEPMKHANDRAEERNIKSDFKNSMPTRNTSRQDSKTADEENTPLNLKKEPVQHKKSCEGERNNERDPKNQIPSLNPLVKQDRKSSPLQIQRQLSPGDFIKSEVKSDKNQTKHTSEKPQLHPSNKVLKPQERSSSGERKQRTPAAEDTMSPETKAVRENNEHECSGKYQLHPSRKSAECEENTPAGQKHQTRCEDFMMPDKKAAKEKSKFPISRKYRSLSSETLVRTQEKNTAEQKQQTSASAGFKKSGTNDVKKKDGDPKCKTTPSSKKVVKSQEKNTSEDRRQKTPAAEDIRSPKTKAVKEDNKHHHSGNHQLPPLSKSAKPEKNMPGGENQQPVSESFTKPDANAVKDKTQDLGSGMCQSPSSNLLVKSQEKNVTAKKKQLTSSADEKTTYKTSSPEKKSGPERREKYQLRSSALTEKHGNDGSGKKGPVDNLKSHQTPLLNDDMTYKNNTTPKETSLPNTEKSPKSSLFHDASKYEKNPAENRENQPGFKKYQAFSSKNLVSHEKDVAESEGSWQAAGETGDRKAELEDCSKAASFAKYTVESYSERLLDSSFKPLIIRVTDTFKHPS